jgi:hypothetical protein
MTRIVIAHRIAGARRVASRARRLPAAMAFARWLAGRHRVCQRALGRIDLPLVGRQQPLVQYLLHRHVNRSFLITARIATALHDRRHATIVRSTNSQTVSSPPAIAPGTSDRATPPMAESSRETLVLRLMRRTERVEVGPPSRHVDREGAATAEATARHQFSTAAIFPLAPTSVMRASASREHSAATATERAEPDAEARTRSAHPGHPSRGEVVTTMPDGEVERIADRVIGSIDRRIAAHRERLGRF